MVDPDLFPHQPHREPFSFRIPSAVGGGASNCINGDGENVSSCAGGYAKPSWQSGVPGIPADGARDLPDVSFMAGNGFLGSAYLICVSANGSCVTSTSLTTPPEAQEVGGTSVGTPAMAGVMALINQKAGTRREIPTRSSMRWPPDRARKLSRRVRNDKRWMFVQRHRHRNHRHGVCVGLSQLHREP